MGCTFKRKRPKLFHFLTEGCQFTGMPLTTTKTEIFCAFHLPITAFPIGGGNNKTQWSLEKIREFNESFFAVLKSWQMAGNGVFDITGVEFPGDIEFSDAFQKLPQWPVCFGLARFFGRADFGNQTFHGDASFDQARFHQHAEFGSTTFRGHASFDRATFNKKMSFYQATFQKTAAFRKAQFDQVAYFEDARFKDLAYFQNAIFTKYADFQLGGFEKAVNFHEAQFHGTARFRQRHFGGNANFNGSWNKPGDKSSNTPNTFNELNFENATIVGTASFQNRKFLANTSFESCLFMQAPRFEESKLHQATTFPTINSFRDTTSADAIPAYRTLKLAMENVRSRDEEAMFFALEQKSRRNQEDTPGSVKVFSYLYEGTADYGRSFAQPIACLAALTAVFWLFYFVVALAMSNQVVALEQSFRFTMTQVVRPFGVWLPNTGDKIIELVMVSDGRWPTLLRVAALIQSLFSLSLVTLFLLAVRRRFKLG